MYFDFFLVMISLLISGATFRLISLWTKSIRHSARLTEKNGIQIHTTQIVSIVVPARNEEKYIKNCIESLLKQDYPNFELILVNDKSDDHTLDIMKRYSEREHNVQVIDLDYKPDDWIGKSWGCYRGYLQAEGEILLFTDADTYHNKSTLRLAIPYFTEHKLDALSLLPKMLAPNFIAKVTLPFLTLYQQTYISPININDPTKKTINFLAQFYMIKKKVYEKNRYSYISQR